MDHFRNRQRIRPLGALVATSDGAVDDVGGSLGVSGPSSIEHIYAADIPKDVP